MDILDNDEDRARWLNRKANSSSTSQLFFDPSHTTHKPKSHSLRGNNYLLTIGLGIPMQEFSLMFDTASDLSWLECDPCIKCLEQNNARFVPANSSTYGTVSCTTDKCRQVNMLGMPLPNSESCSQAGTCRYKLLYGDGFQTGGDLGQDILMLGSEAIPNFIFGCSYESRGLFGTSNGLIGLGRGSASLVSQLSPQYGAIFSYCIPSSTSTTGNFAIGDTGEAASSDVHYTPMVSIGAFPSFYFVNLTAIKVGGRELPIEPAVYQKQPMIVDSGTTVTRLPLEVYRVLSSTFKQHTKYPALKSGISILDTCFDFTGHNEVWVPKVELVFDGGATLAVDFTGTVYVDQKLHGCLGFAASSDLTILGSMQQKRHSIVFDIENNKIGFSANACK